MALELKVSTDNYQAQISMLEAQLAILRGIAGEYQSLQAQVSSFSNDGEVLRMARTAEEAARRVDNAIDATMANIKTLQQNVETISRTGQNIATIIDEGINIVSSLL